MRDKMIIEHIELAKKLANRIGGTYPNQMEDLHGCAMEALVLVCDKITKSDENHTNVSGYISKTIKYELLNHMKRCHVVYVPYEARQIDHEHDNVDTSNLKSISNAVHPGTGLEFISLSGETGQIDIESVQESKIYYDEILQSLELDSLQYFLIEKKMEGHSDKTLAKWCGMSKQWMADQMREIRRICTAKGFIPKESKYKKKCSMCGRMLPLSYYYYRKEGGLRPHCKECI